MFCLQWSMVCLSVLLFWLQVGSLLVQSRWLLSAATPFISLSTFPMPPSCMWMMEFVCCQLMSRHWWHAAACCSMCALGVPFSWEKMSFGQTSSFQWLGWCFDLTKPCAFVPQSKREKLLPLLDLLCKPCCKARTASGRAGSGPAALACRWAPMAQAHGWKPLYKILYKPRAVPRLVNLAQLANIIQCLAKAPVAL